MIAADLGLPDAEEHQLKARVVALIAQQIEQRELCPAEAAARMGLNRLELPAILRGRFRGLTLERLLQLAHALGADITDVLLDQRVSILNEAEHDAFVRMLENPPKADEKLKALLRRKPPWA